MKPEEVEEDPMATMRAQKVISDDESARGKAMHFFYPTVMFMPVWKPQRRTHREKGNRTEHSSPHFFLFLYTTEQRKTEPEELKPSRRYAER
jgi:hypothetical protein